MEKNISRAEISQKEILTRVEVAVYLGFSVGYINQLCAKRIIPFYKPMGKMSFFKREEVDAWCLSNRIKTMDEINGEAMKA